MGRVARGARALAARSAAVVGVALMCATLGGQARAHAAPAAAPAQTPEHLRAALGRHEFKTLQGESLTLGALKGQVVVLNFWATWCAPCRRELPCLDSLSTAMSGQGGRVIAISIDTDRQNVVRFRKDHHLTLPIVHEGPDGLARELDLQHIPFTVVFDRDGAVAYSSYGADARAQVETCALAKQLLTRSPYVARTPE